MTPEETKQLLAKAAVTDHRTVDLVSIRAWHEIIGHLAYDEVLEALTMHRRESAEYLQPAHIVSGVRRVRADHARETDRQRALEAAPSNVADLTERSIRRRIMDTPAWKAAFDKGRINGNADRAYNTTLRETGSKTKAAYARWDILKAAGE
jgi:hypothetical protein